MAGMMILYLGCLMPGMFSVSCIACLGDRHHNLVVCAMARVSAHHVVCVCVCARARARVLERACVQPVRACACDQGPA